MVHSPKKTEWMNVTTQQKQEREQEERERKRERGRERKSSYFTPMQHAEEIQLPFKLHDSNQKH